jgi:hypothetical protein
MRLLPGYEMASNAQAYIVKIALIYTASMGLGLRKIAEIAAFFRPCRILPAFQTFACPAKNTFANIVTHIIIRP